MNDRQTHIDLLAQVADSTRERDEVRRILSEPLTRRKADRAWCSRCESGLTGCTTPEACERSGDSLGAARGVMYAIPLALALWAAIAGVLIVLGVAL